VGERKREREEIKIKIEQAREGQRERGVTV
jgi:hypothetical protein